MLNEVTNLPDEEVKAIEEAIAADDNKNSAEQETPADKDDSSEETADEQAPVTDEPEDGQEQQEQDDPGENDSVLISDELLQDAVKAGMTLADARSYSSPEVLTRMIGLLQKDTVKKDSSQEPDAIEDVDEVLKNLPEFDPDEVAPEIAAAFKGMTDIVKTLHGQIVSLKSEQSRQVSQNVAAWFDSQVSMIGSDYEGVLGKGPKSALVPGSEAFNNRGKIADKMDVLKAGYKAVGKEVPADEMLFREAAESIFGNQVYKDKLNRELKDRSGKHLQPPTNKKVKATQTQLSVEDEIAREIDAEIAKNQ